MFLPYLKPIVENESGAQSLVIRLICAFKIGRNKIK
jgi:hypothetical protein